FLYYTKGMKVMQAFFHAEHRSAGNGCLHSPLPLRSLLSAAGRQQRSANFPSSGRDATLQGATGNSSETQKA
ncbi:MAG: hypothetical protein LUF68_03055, partial [Clostridiales bacterium]|nr:hypothetical protein [Clostridiales bacterium]